MPLPILAPQAVAAQAQAAGLSLDPERLEAVAAALAFIRAEIAKLDQPCLADARFAQPIDPDWRSAPCKLIN